VTRAAPLAVALLAACAPPVPEPHARIAAWAPQGKEVAREAVAIVDFTAPVSPTGLTDGRRAALARAADARAVATAAGSESGLAGDAPVIATEATLLPGGQRLQLRPRSPLPAGLTLALVIGAGATDAEGRTLLDPEGRPRTFVATFETIPGPPPRPVLTEVRAVATAPEAGGEYLELLNMGDGPLDLAGWRLEKRTTTGTLAGCTIAAEASAVLAPGDFGLVTGGAWDGRYRLPPGLPRATCGAGALAGGLADERPPEVRLLDASGLVQATLGEGGAAPRCPAAVERIDPAGPDASWNLACALDGGTPGTCNSVSPGCP